MTPSLRCQFLGGAWGLDCQLRPEKTNPTLYRHIRLQGNVSRPKNRRSPSGAHLVQEAVMGDRKLSRSLRVAPPRQANIEDEPGMLGGPVRQAEIENSSGIVGGPARQGDIENAPGMFGDPARQAEIEGAPGVVGGPPRQGEIGAPARQAEMEDAPGLLGRPSKTRRD
eukprot:jgi/Botrbrau1/135/Bobra.0022s0121.1